MFKLLFSFFHLFEVAQIQNISLMEYIQTPYTTEGIVAVKYADVWSNVCYYGDRKSWGKREGITACRQLGYEGGWPLMANQSKPESHIHLRDFDCNECEYITCHNSVIFILD